MLTPIFVCEEDESFVIVSITLSALCKVTKASFSILNNQFTFHCAPYYLRLKFDQRIAEGRGERATYTIETHVLTVYIPKERKGEAFTQLDNPAYLIATDKERRQMVRVVGGGTVEALAEQEEEEETEFCQRLPSCIENCEGGGDYGFAGGFSGMFSLLDPDVVADVLDLQKNPEKTTAEERRRLRMQAENSAFDEDALLVSFEDAEGEVQRLLRYVPQHRADYIAALDAEKVSYVVPSAFSVQSATANVLANCDKGMLEEEDAVLPLAGGVVDVWAGNIAEFKKPLLEEVCPESECTVEGVGAQAEVAVDCGLRFRSAGSLAVPHSRPCVHFSLEEREVMMNIRAPRLLFLPTTQVVDALTLDILFSEAYDDIVTEGSGCSESLWNVCKLSPALSWLDPADNVYDACVFFARRALIYPLHRNFALVNRVFSSVGVRLILGKMYVIKALLRVRTIIAHAEHRHVLVTLFLNPLIGYWLSVHDADERLMRLALDLHSNVTRVEPEVEKMSAASPLFIKNERKLFPLNLLSIGLPFA